MGSLATVRRRTLGTLSAKTWRQVSASLLLGTACRDLLSPFFLLVSRTSAPGRLFVREEEGVEREAPSIPIARVRRELYRTLMSKTLLNVYISWCFSDSRGINLFNRRSWCRDVRLPPVEGPLPPGVDNPTTLPAPRCNRHHDYEPLGGVRFRIQLHRRPARGLDHMATGI